MKTYQQHSRRKLALTIISIAVVAGVIVFADHLKAHTASTVSLRTPVTPTRANSSASNTSPSSSGGPAAPATSAAAYKDGTFTATSGYYVPSGDESIQVSLTLQNGVVTGASVRNSESDPTSAMFQQDFASAYKSYVIGQKISDLQLGVIAGASDTSHGFEQAVQRISSEAQA